MEEKAWVYSQTCQQTPRDLLVLLKPARGQAQPLFFSSSLKKWFQFPEREKTVDLIKALHADVIWKPCYQSLTDAQLFTGTISHSQIAESLHYWDKLNQHGLSPENSLGDDGPPSDPKQNKEGGRTCMASTVPPYVSKSAFFFDCHHTTEGVSPYGVSCEWMKLTDVSASGWSFCCVPKQQTSSNGAVQAFSAQLPIIQHLS